MRKTLTYVSVGVLIVAASVFLVTVRAADAPEMITLDDCGSKQPPVEFTHGKHAQSIECATCHHTQPDLTASSGEAEACASCHKEPEDPKTPTCSHISPTKNSFHIQCMGCHKTEKKKDAALKAPVACKECHVK
jgi:hypothetical protein